MTEPLQPLVVIAGPTATGKTAAAIEVARRFDGELVGADSVQVYRGFDIGSAKPTGDELGGVPHHLLDVLDPDQDIDAVAYANLADAAIRDIHGRGRLAVVVGGTGLWIRALVRGLVDVPPVDPGIRERLEETAAAQGAPALHAKLALVDPISADAVHPNDTLRIVRALEVYEQTGTPLGTLRAAHALGKPRYRAVFVVLDMNSERHGIVIEDRAKQMLDTGWIDEVCALRTRWGDDIRPFGSVGYREVLEHIRDGSEPGVSWRSESAELREASGLDRIAEELRL